MNSLTLETVEIAAYRLKLMGIACVRWHRFDRLNEQPIELIGSVQQIAPSEHDVDFVIVAGPDYDAHRLKLSRCEVCPLVDGRPAWDFSFSIPSLLWEKK